MQAINDSNYEIDPNTPVLPKIWNPIAAACWSLLFTPAFGAYVHMVNWKALGELKKANTAKKWFGFYMIFLAIQSIYLLSSVGSPVNGYQTIFRAISFGILVSWYLLSGHKQTTFIKDRFNGVYLKKSWKWPLFFAILSFLAYLLIFVLLGLIRGL